VETIVLIHLVATCALSGLIWFVQLVHYPLFALVGEDRFVAYERAHQARIAPLVATLMVAELACAIAIARTTPMATLGLASLALVAVIWLSTALIQVPCHRRLQRSFDAQAHARLLASNWIRTVAWTLRVPLAIALLKGS